MHKIAFLLFCFMLLFHTAIAQQLRQYPEQGYAKSYLTDTRDLIIQPAKWKAKEWLVVGGSAVVFTVIYAYDAEINSAFQNQRTQQTEWISQNIAEPFGSGLYTLPALGLLYGSGWVFDNKKSRDVALLATKAWVLTGGATFVLKQVAHRQRPYEGDFPNPRSWHGPYGLTSDFTSFPSGHTSTAFAVAAVLAGSYSDQKWIGISSYALATLAGLSRIHDNVHWASDVFVGGLLGWWIGHSLVKMNGPITWGAHVGGDQFLASFLYCF